MKSALRSRLRNRSILILSMHVACIYSVHHSRIYNVYLSVSIRDCMSSVCCCYGRWDHQWTTSSSTIARPSSGIFCRPVSERGFGAFTTVNRPSSSAASSVQRMPSPSPTPRLTTSPTGLRPSKTCPSQCPSSRTQANCVCPSPLTLVSFQIQTLLHLSSSTRYD